MNRNSLWRWLLLTAVVVVGVLFALPNLFGEDPAIQVSSDSGDVLDESFVSRVDAILSRADIEALSVAIVDGQLLARMPDDTAQLAAAESLREVLGRDYVVALSLAPRTPGWLVGLGAEPMSLGLDLRGGVHFLLEVDAQSVRETAMERYLQEIPAFLRARDLRYTSRKIEDGSLIIAFRDAATLDEAQSTLNREYRELSVEDANQSSNALVLALTEEEEQRILDFAVKQNLTTLRSRVNQLGVAEPVVQRQGASRILVQLPGVQDTTRIKDVLGATATLEYRAVALEGDPDRAARTGIAPAGTQLFFERDTDRPYLLKRDIIATGNELVDAAATVDQESGTPAVSVTLDGRAAKRMFEFTEKNVGNPMAVLYKETIITTTYDENGDPQFDREQIEEIISVATIRGVFGKRFQTTGLTSKEAHDLALLLRAGALAAPIAIVEERTIGPSLGQDNVEQGRNATILGFALVVLFMAMYYKVFGLIANAALLLNVVMIVAVLSMLQATLTLPGIAGMLLTVGMAVDANVLIFQRIREELKAGAKPQEAIAGGYDKAFSTIADANITTLIAAVVLFIFGTGPVKGFAVTLSIGIISSMFTAIFGTRVLVNALFGGRRLSKLPI
jgi:preprotein translocase subunit SecD